MNTSTGGFWYWDLKQNELLLSPQCKAILGYGPHEAIDFIPKWEELIHPADHATLITEYSACRDGYSQRLEVELRMRHKNGTWKPVLSRGEIYRESENGPPLRMIGTHIDLSCEDTDRKEIESAREAAEEARLAKSLFLANISHELRTPLNGVLGLSNLLLEMLEDEEQQELLAMITYSAENLNQIIQDLLDINRFDAGRIKLEYELFDLTDLAEELLNTIRPAAERKGVELASKISDLAEFYGDRNRIGQIISNLLSNALKYTEEGSIYLGMNRIENSLQIEVIDTGIGIPQEKVSTVFESFEQLENPYTKKHSGLGLGLAIVRQLTDLHDGTITVQSQEGSGTTFSVKLPWRESVKTVVSACEEEEGMTDRSMRVLIVEDEAINRIYLRTLLERRGHIVSEARNGEEAVELWRQENEIDLVLMDIGLPKLDGNAAIQAIRSLERDSGREHCTPILALTAHAYQEDQDRSMVAGADGFLTKPVNETDLFRCIGDLMQKNPCDQHC